MVGNDSPKAMQMMHGEVYTHTETSDPFEVVDFR